MFKNRSDKKELLDGDNIPDNHLFQNLKELNTINRLLGGYNITFNALKKVLKTNRAYVIVDIGSGGGDTLKQIYNWNKHYNLNLYGIDLKQTCVNYSNTNNPVPGITFICDDYKNALNHINKIDILHACLFCHHLNNQQIIELIQFCGNNKITLIINDLERNPFAYYAIKILTKLFSKSYLVKNDAPLSVLRGFKLKEWQHILKQSGATNYSIKYKWAFRHEVIVYA
jgi:2-polyprenyl-3-methyl-5-hydroxy-6-metoxy-1,4-benzoquinol methylase